MIKNDKPSKRVVPLRPDDQVRADAGEYTNTRRAVLAEIDEEEHHLDEDPRSSSLNPISMMLKGGDARPLLEQLSEQHLAEQRANGTRPKPRTVREFFFGTRGGVAGRTQDTLRVLTETVDEATTLFKQLDEYQKHRTALALTREKAEVDRARVQEQLVDANHRVLKAETRIDDGKLEAHLRQVELQVKIAEAENLLRWKQVEAERIAAGEAVHPDVARLQEELGQRDHLIDVLQGRFKQMREELDLQSQKIAAAENASRKLRTKCKQLRRRLRRAEKRLLVARGMKTAEPSPQGKRHQGGEEIDLRSVLAKKEVSKEIAKLEAEIASFERTKRAAEAPIIPDEDLSFIENFLTSRKKSEKLQALDEHLDKVAQEHGDDSTEYANAQSAISDLRARLVDGEAGGQ